MLDLPTKIIQMLGFFKGAFSERVWEWAKELLIGAILAPGELSPGTQSCQMVEPSSEPDLAGAAGEPLCACYGSRGHGD
jgi:hypothetical protein